MSAGSPQSGDTSTAPLAAAEPEAGEGGGSERSEQPERRPPSGRASRRARVVVPGASDVRVRVRRRKRVVPAILAAGFLLVLGVLVAIDVIAVNTGSPKSIVFPYEEIADQLRSNHWGNLPILAVAAFVVLIGVVLLLVAAVPARKGRLAVASGDPEVVASVSHHSLRQLLAAAAVGVPGISKVRVKVGRRSVRVRADSRLHDPAGLAADVASDVGERLRSIGPARKMRVRVRVRKRSD